MKQITLVYAEQTTMTTNGTFSHRINSDRTVDSICHKCFATVATAKHESELLAEEELHACDPPMVDWYRRQLREMLLSPVLGTKFSTA